MFIIYFRYFRFSGHSIISGFGNRDMLKAATDLPYHVLELFLVITGLSFNGDQERSSGHYQFVFQWRPGKEYWSLPVFCLTRPLQRRGGVT